MDWLWGVDIQEGEHARRGDYSMLSLGTVGVSACGAVEATKRRPVYGVGLMAGSLWFTVYGLRWVVYGGSLMLGSLRFTVGSLRW